MVNVFTIIVFSRRFTIYCYTYVRHVIEMVLVSRPFIIAFIYLELMVKLVLGSVVIFPFLFLPVTLWIRENL